MADIKIDEAGQKRFCDLYKKLDEVIPYNEHAITEHMKNTIIEEGRVVFGCKVDLSKITLPK